MGDDENECCKNMKISKFAEVFNSSAKFRIYGMLAMFSELSLTELSQKLGKSKSTIWDHLQRMIEIGMVEEREGEQVRSNIKPKIYSLTKEANDSGLADEDLSHLNEKERLFKKIEMLNTFVDIQMNVLETWKRYNDSLKKKLAKDLVDEVKEEFNEFKSIKKLTTITFYTDEEADEFLEKSKEINFQIEQKREDNEKFSEQTKPFFGCFILAPYKYFLNYLNPPKE